MVRAEEKKLATQVQRYWNETESDDLADIDPEIERSKSYLLRFFEGSFRETLEATGFGYQTEIEMLKAAHELDMLSIGYAFNEEETERLIKEADVDIYIFHAGITRGGSTGYSKGRSLEEMAQKTQQMYDTAKRIKPDVILLAHGSALASPKDAQYLLDHTDAHGIQLGSAIERLAIEEPLRQRTEAFKKVKVGRQTG